jgi:hypothetical protein
MDDFNFVSLEKKKLGGGGAGKLGSTLRIRKNTLAIGNEVMRAFNPVQDSKGVYRSYISFQYDAQHRAIRLVEDRVNGFVLAGGNPDGAMTCNTPVAMREAGVVLGDYVPVEGRVNIFRLAQ